LLEYVYVVLGGGIWISLLNESGVHCEYLVKVHGVVLVAILCGCIGYWIGVQRCWRYLSDPVCAGKGIRGSGLWVGWCFMAGCIVIEVGWSAGIIWYNQPVIGHQLELFSDEMEDCIKRRH